MLDGPRKCHAIHVAPLQPQSCDDSAHRSSVLQGLLRTQYASAFVLTINSTAACLTKNNGSNSGCDAASRSSWCIRIYITVALLSDACTVTAAAAVQTVYSAVGAHGS
eukprot:10431-Heterococcus_DN1.PRE.1